MTDDNSPALSIGITGREPMLGGDRRKIHTWDFSNCQDMHGVIVFLDGKLVGTCATQNAEIMKQYIRDTESGIIND